MAVHGPEGWADPVMLGSATHAIFRSAIARNDAGDVVFAWTPGCFGGPAVEGYVGRMLGCG